MSHIHRYQGQTITVEFDLELCIHSGDCTRDLPAVFDIQQRGRWVQADAAEADRVAEVCARCPTGALRCIHKDSGEFMAEVPERNTVKVMENGPLYVHGRISLKGKALPAYRAALCRCGSSRNMPWCDGAHTAAGFSDQGAVKPFNPDAEITPGILDIRPLRNGSLYLVGPQYLCDAEGNIARVSKKCALCRCGASSSKPYCDSSHFETGFKSD